MRGKKEVKNMLLQIQVCIWIFMYLFLIQLGEKKNGLEENFFIFFNFILAFFSWQVLGFCAHACKKKKTLEIGVCSKTLRYASSMLM